jgi:hypothetical protein
MMLAVAILEASLCILERLGGFSWLHGEYIQGLPAIRTEQKMDNMVFNIRLTSEIRIDHLTNWCRSVCDHDYGLASKNNTLQL